MVSELLRAPLTVAITSGGPTQDITISGETRTPIGIEVWVSGATGFGTAGATDHARMCVGFYDGTTSRCHSWGSEDGIGGDIADTFRGRYTDRVIHLHNKADRNSECAASVTFITGGGRLNWSNLPADAVAIDMRFIFGDATVEVMSKDTNATIGGTVEFDPEFKPDWVHFASSSLGDTANNVNRNHMRAQYGAAHRTAGDGIQQYAIVAHDEDNPPGVQSQGAGLASESRVMQAVDIDQVGGIPITYVAGIKVGAELTSWTDDGFILTTRDAGTAISISALMVKNTSPQPHGIAQGETHRTTSGTKDFDTYALGEGDTGIAATASFVSGISHHHTTSKYGIAQKSDQAMRFSAGAADLTRDGCVGFVIDEDAATTDTKSTAKGSLFFDTDIAASDDSTVIIDSVSSGTLTLDWTSAISESDRGIFLEWFSDESLVFEGSFALALSALSVDFDAALEFRGTFDVTLPSLTAGVDAELQLRGTFGPSLAPLQAAFIGTQDFRGTFAPALPALATAFTLAQQFRVSFAPSLASLATAFVGSVDFRGTFAPTLTPIAASFSGLIQFRGTFAPSVASLETAFAGTVELTGDFTATFAVSVPPLSVAFVGGQEFRSTFAVSVPGLQTDFQAAQQFRGTFALALPSLETDFAGLLVFEADFSEALPSLQTAFVVVWAVDISGTFAVVLPSLQTAFVLRAGVLATRTCLAGSYVLRTSLAGSYVLRANLTGSYDLRTALAASYELRTSLAGSYVTRTNLTGSLKTCE